MALLKRSLQALHEQAKTRPPGYVDDVLRHAQRVDDDHYWIDPQAYLDLCRRWQAASLPTSQLSKSRQIITMARSAARATRSITRTSLGINRATDEQVEARLPASPRSSSTVGWTSMHPSGRPLVSWTCWVSTTSSCSTC